ncbi:SRPBCC family protein [Primorskyibacter sp. S87]|uniref:SRPBCC family protein n=1 Tax=Primorskyibacter sp. S87 TaxID=3415126 RepID=UPI003C7BBD1D
MTDTNLQKTIYLGADPDTVWSFLTDPDQLETWFHRPSKPLTQGAKIEMCGADGKTPQIWGEVLEARRPDFLRYTFCVKPMGDTVSTVSWTLTAVPGGTRLSLLHEGLPQGAEAFGLVLALDNGWDEHFASMRKAVSALEIA